MGASLISLIFQLAGDMRCAENVIRSRMSLSRAEYEALSCFEKGDELACSELSRRMGLSPSRASRVIETSVRAGLIERQESLSDRRCKRLRLTSRGVSVRKKISGYWRQREKEMEKLFSPSRINTLKKDLRTAALLFKKSSSGAIQ